MDGGSIPEMILLTPSIDFDKYSVHCKVQIKHFTTGASDITKNFPGYVLQVIIVSV